MTKCASHGLFVQTLLLSSIPVVLTILVEAKMHTARSGTEQRLAREICMVNLREGRPFHIETIFRKTGICVNAVLINSPSPEKHVLFPQLNILYVLQGNKTGSQLNAGFWGNYCGRNALLRQLIKVHVFRGRADADINIGLQVSGLSTQVPTVDPSKNNVVSLQR